MAKTRWHKNGSFVMHGLHIGNDRVSAWFDAYGNPVDAERFNRKGRRFDVKVDGPIWNRLRSIGSAEAAARRWQREPVCEA